MDESFIQTQTGFSVAEEPSWNLDEMVNRVSRTLHVEVDLLSIRLTLIDILVEYENAPIKTYVPIFACRKAEEVLKKKIRNLPVNGRSRGPGFVDHHISGLVTD